MSSQHRKHANRLRDTEVGFFPQFFHLHRAKTKWALESTFPSGFLSGDLMKFELQPPQSMMVASIEKTLNKQASEATLLLITGTSLPHGALINFRSFFLP